MYLEPDDALGLIRDCAARFPGGQMMFDSIPHWFSRRTLKGLKLSDRYIAPPMPFALTADEARRPGRPHPRRARRTGHRRCHARARLLQAGRLAAAGPPRVLRRNRPSITLLEFGWRYDPICGVSARRQRRRRQPQDGRGGQGVRGRRIHQCANDFGQRQRAAGQPRRGGRGPEEGREGVARHVRLRRLGAGLRHRHRAQRSPKGSRSSARSTATTPTSRSSPTPRCSTNSPAWPRTPGPTRRSNAARASSTGRSPNKGTLDTTIGKTMGKKRYKSSTTTRNLRTVEKMLR